SADSKLGQAISFDGLHYVEVPYSPSFFPRSDLAFTAEAMIKVNSYLATRSTIIYREDYFWIYVFTGGHIGLRLTNFSGASRTWVYLEPIGALDDKNWHHVLVTYDPTVPIVKVYLDGIRTFSTDFSFGAPGPASFYQVPIYIGGTSAGYYFDGLIDNVRIYHEYISQQ
ncbi:MAG: LamG domain-containing protein, partial [bacterium]|nr:LamG domain-containing protein [bacterium]